MSQIPGFDPNLILGPVELGVVFASILFGCAVVQTYVYYKKFPKDPWRIKALVASEMALQIAHLLCLIAAMWTMTVSNYGAPQTLISWPHTSIAAVLLSAPITFPVQAFFTWRLYKISQDRIIPAFCFLLAFARLVCNSILGIAGFYIPDALVYEQKYKWAITSVLASSICCDVTIAAALSYHLYSRRGSGMKQTTRLLDQMIVYTIETGLATTLTDLVEGICFWTMPTNNVWIGFYSFESALYMNSLLAALNSRVLFRQMRNSEGVVEFEFDTRRSDAAAVSGSEQRRKPHHPIVISVTKEVDSSSQKGLGRDVLGEFA